MSDPGPRTDPITAAGTPSGPTGSNCPQAQGVVPETWDSLFWGCTCPSLSPFAPRKVQCFRGAKADSGRHRRNTLHRPLAWLWVGLWVLALSGCHPSPQTEPDKPPLAGTRVRLLIVGDAPLATAAARLQGEWQAQTGSEFEISQTTEEQFAHGPNLEQDAVIGPSHQLGPAVQRGWLAPLTRKALQEATGNWSEIYELARLHDTSWGEKNYGVPLGAPILVCYCRADLLARLDRQPPRTWTEYQELARLLSQHPPAATPEANRTAQDWSATAEPLGPGWAGLTLLARAACYAKHPDNYSTLFRIDDLEPLIDGPPFVRALEELVAAAKLSPKAATGFTPADTRAAFWQGRCGLALTWPTAAEPLPSHGDSQVKVLFAELPGSANVYHVGAKQWQARAPGDEGRVTLLGLAGRVGMVSATAQYPAATLQLLSWLSAAQPEHPLAAASGATTLSRPSQEKWPQAWTEKPVGAAAGQYVAILKRAQQRQQWLGAPRIPGRTEYLAALDQAVAAALAGSPPADALRQAADRWRQITARLGPAQQRAAYLRSLELEPD